MEAVENDTYAWFENWIVNENHPCIMAQTVFRMKHVNFKEYENFGSAEAAGKILEDIDEYVRNYDFTTNDFFTFIATFPNSEKAYSEEDFEKILWQQLEHLHALDNCPWDENVSQNPQNNNFSFSLKGKAFYIVGMHQNSSRIARQTPSPTIVFNLHYQFEKLREMKKFKLVRDRIRKRDKKLQGSINPVLVDFGTRSEALQYSGREVEGDWKCPFHSSNVS